MHQGKKLVPYCCNSLYLIWLFIQSSISPGNSLLCSKDIVPQIPKFWLQLRVSIIGMGTLWVVSIVFIPTTNHLSSSLVSQTLVDASSNGPPSFQTSFLVSLQYIVKEKTTLFWMPSLAYQHHLLPCPLVPLYSYHPFQLLKRVQGVLLTKLSKNMRTLPFQKDHKDGC